MDQFIDAAYVSSVNLGNACLMVYDTKTGACIKNFRGNCISENTLRAIGNEDYLFSSHKDKPLLQCWEINKYEPLPTRFSVPGKVTTIAIDEKNNEFCILGISEKIFIYSLSSGIQFGVINRHYQNITCLAFTSCGNYFASAGEDGFVYLWSMSSLFESLHKADKPQVQPQFVLGQHADKVTGLVITENGIRGILITSSADRCGKIFDLSTGKLRHNIIAKSGLTSVCCNHIGSQIFFGDENGKVWGCNLLPHRDNTDIQLEGEGSKCHEKPVAHMCLTPSGDSILTGSNDEDVKVWSIVMSAKNNWTFNVPYLAFQRVLHTGRGAITNILIKKIDKEIFNNAKLQSNIVVTAFNNQPCESILDLPVLIRVNREEKPFDPQEFYDLAAELMRAHHDDLGKKSSSSGPTQEEDRTLNQGKNPLENSNQLLYRQLIAQVIGK